MIPMRALTLWQPWAWAMGCGLKKIENRSWQPPMWMLDEWLALHAGMKWDGASDAALRKRLYFDADPPMPDRSELVHGAVVAVAKLCALHGEPFRERWPKGMAQVVILVCDEVLQDPELWALADEIVAARPEIATPFDGIREALADVRVCCRVAKERLMRLYIDAGIGRLRRCVICKQTRQGTPMRSLDPKTRVVSTLRQVCFYCTVYNAVDARAA